MAVGEAAGDRDRPGPGGAGAPGRGGLAGAATAGPGRHRPLMGRSGCVGARCRRVDGRDARSHTFWSCCCSSRSALCPGFMGRLAGRLMSRVSPAVVQRLLDLLVGGALLAQVTLATGPGAPPGHRWDGSEVVSTASLAIGGSVGPSTLSGLATTSHAGDGVAGHSRRWDRPERGPLPAGQRRRCRPGWGGGPSNAAPSHGDEAGGTVAPAHSSNPGTSAAPGHRQAPGDPKVAVRLPLRRGARGLSDRFGY